MLNWHALFGKTIINQMVMSYYTILERSILAINPNVAKVEDAADPSLPKVRNSILWLHLWQRRICGILGFPEG